MVKCALQVLPTLEWIARIPEAWVKQENWCVLKAPFSGVLIVTHRHKKDTIGPHQGAYLSVKCVLRVLRTRASIVHILEALESQVNLRAHKVPFSGVLIATHLLERCVLRVLQTRASIVHIPEAWVKQENWRVHKAPYNVVLSAMHSHPTDMIGPRPEELLLEKYVLQVQQTPEWTVCTHVV
ncbi:hypothetical protein EBZ39_04030 [bacterium]|nr:hypothetical protein [bacterium]